MSAEIQIVCTYCKIIRFPWSEIFFEKAAIVDKCLFFPAEFRHSQFNLSKHRSYVTSQQVVSDVRERFLNFNQIVFVCELFH